MPPQVAPQGYTRIWCGNGSSDSLQQSRCVEYAANSDPVGAHPKGMLCLDAQQLSLLPAWREGCAETESRWSVLPVCLLWCGTRHSLGSQQHCPCLENGACQVGLVPDSGLDASSQYPSLGSFTTPVARLMVETRGVPQGFLSYYHVMPSSRPSQER